MRKPWIGIALRILAGLAAAGAIALILWLTVDPGRDTIEIGLGSRPVTLLEPRWLYLIAIVPFFFVVRAFSLTDVSFTQQYLQAGLRSLIIAGLAIALARPAWTTSDNKISTVVLVDVSKSISDKQLEAAQKYVKELSDAKRPEDDLQLISFAERPEVVRDLKAPLARHQGAGAGTNIQSAIQLGYGLFPDGYLPRMVIISDGNQTNGDVFAEAYRAQEFGVQLSWKMFPSGRTDEIRVVAIHLPDEVKVGAPFDVEGEIWSTREDDVTLSLYQDEFPNGLEPTKKVTLHEGVNRIKFKSEAKRAGFTTYTMKLVKSHHDTETANNTAVMTTPVKGKPNILYVEGGVIRDPGQAGYLKRALEHENMDVEVRGPRGLPSSAKALEKYDLVLVSDVPAHFVGLGQMQALESYVRDYGGGLIMAGGEDSFGSGGYQGTRIEKIMPVRFDSEKIREQPNIAIALVIDRSGSMSGPKIEAAKESARATAEVLSPSDLISVIAFDSQPTTIVRLQRASSRMRISADISRLTAGGGTNIHPALKEAYDTLAAARAKVKHVILLSDGQASYDGIAELCQEMRAARITVSAVGIGDADRNLLNIIADNGDGRLYMTDDLAALPRIFMKETTEAQKSALVEDLVKAHVVKRVEAIEGTGVENAPPLHGYVSTKPKPKSEVILISDMGEPLLARWRVGIGTSVAWTSDVKNRWSVEWLRWGGYPKFWAQLIRSSMRRKVYDSYDMYARVDGGVARVMVDAVDIDDKFVNDLDTTLEVIDPRDNKVKKSVPMEQTAAGRYEADFDVDRYGSYMLKAVHKRDGKVVAESTGAVALPYPAEFLKSTPDEEPLHHAAMVTGGTDQAPPDAVWNPVDKKIVYTQDLWPWVLFFVACLLIGDIYFKRVRVFGYRTIKM